MHIHGVEVTDLARQFGTPIFVYDEARIHYQEGIEIFEKNNNTGTFDSELLQARKELSGLPK